jgi:hypothetical protein
MSGNFEDNKEYGNWHQWVKDTYPITSMKFTNVVVVSIHTELEVTHNLTSFSLKIPKKDVDSKA